MRVCRKTPCAGSITFSWTCSQLLRRQIRRVAEGGDPVVSTLRAEGLIPTYTHDTVVPIPDRGEGREADAVLLREVGKAITEIVVKGDHHQEADRLQRVRTLIRDYAERQREAVV